MSIDRSNEVRSARATRPTGLMIQAKPEALARLMRLSLTPFAFHLGLIGPAEYLRTMHGADFTFTTMTWPA